VPLEWNLDHVALSLPFVIPRRITFSFDRRVDHGPDAQRFERSACPLRIADRHDRQHRRIEIPHRRLTHRIRIDRADPARVREFAPMEDGIGAGTADGVLAPDSGDGDE
jgi:hypothetical protein